MSHRALLPLILFLGCAGEGAGVRVTSVEFGVVSNTGTHFAELAVMNSGSKPAQLLRVEQRSGARVFSITPSRVSFLPGDRAQWNVAFAPSSEGLFEARFAAVFDVTTTEFTVRARAAAPCVTEPFFDVGDARLGFTTTRTIRVSNPLDEAAELFVGSPAAPFSVEPAGTLRLAAHEEGEVTVSFAPTLVGRSERTWVIAPRTDCTSTQVELTALAFDAPLTLSPGRLDFGVLTPGTPRALSVEVRNHSRSELTLRSSSFSHASFRQLTALPLVVPANGVATLQVVALAADATPFDGTLHLTTDAIDQPELSLPLLGNRLGPCVSATPSSLSFADVEAGCRGHDALVQLTNTCPHPVQVRGSTLSPWFSFTVAPPPATLEPSQTMEFAITHTPPTPGAKSGSLSFDIDVLDGTQHLEVPLTGLATAPVELEESQLIPDYRPKFDVLLVLDDSPSMLPLAASVAQNLNSFAQYALANEFDTRMGVITTSTAPSELGRLRGTWMANPTGAQLQAAAEIRGAATGSSSCLTAVDAALKQPLDGMLRPGAGIYVICVTNNRDAVEVAPLPLISSILTRLPRPTVISVVAHFVEVANCSATLEHGPLSAWVSLTGGVLEEICTPNWAVALERIGKTHFGYRTRFFLERTPALLRGPLRVFIGRQEIPSTDPNPLLSSRIWEYDGVNNSVNFEPLYVPQSGQTLRFRYVPQCQ